MTTFASLEIGQQFKFFAGGSPLTKRGSRSYDAPQWGQFGNTATDIDQEVIVEPAPSPATQKGGADVYQQDELDAAKAEAAVIHSQLRVE